MRHPSNYQVEILSLALFASGRDDSFPGELDFLTGRPLDKSAANVFRLSTFSDRRRKVSSQRLAILPSRTPRVNLSFRFDQPLSSPTIEKFSIFQGNVSQYNVKHFTRFTSIIIPTEFEIKIHAKVAGYVACSHARIISTDYPLHYIHISFIIFCIISFISSD